MKKEKLDSYLKNMNFKEEDFGFYSMILNKVIEIESLDISRREKECLFNMVVETIQRHFSIKNSFDKAKENLEEMSKNLEKILESLSRISEASNDLKNGVKYLYEVHEKSKDSLKENKFLNN